MTNFGTLYLTGTDLIPEWCAQEKQQQKKKCKSYCDRVFRDTKAGAAMKHHKDAEGSKGDNDSVHSSEEKKKKRTEFPDMEQELSAWITFQCNNDFLASMCIIKSCTWEILESGGSQSHDFQASSRWPDCFLASYVDVCRTVTGIGQEVPENASVSCCNFFDFDNNVVGSLPPSHTGNVGETPLLLTPENNTFDFNDKWGVRWLKRGSWDTLSSWVPWQTGWS